MDKNYGGVIWTNHAMERMRQRDIKQGDAWATWKRPEASEYNKDKGVWIYQRTFSGEQIEVVAKKNDKGKWLILSVWSKKLGIASQKETKSVPQLIKDLFLLKK